MDREDTDAFRRRLEQPVGSDALDGAFWDDEDGYPLGTGYDDGASQGRPDVYDEDDGFLWAQPFDFDFASAEQDSGNVEDAALESASTEDAAEDKLDGADVSSSDGSSEDKPALEVDSNDGAAPAASLYDEAADADATQLVSRDALDGLEGTKLLNVQGEDAADAFADDETSDDEIGSAGSSDFEAPDEGPSDDAAIDGDASYYGSFDFERTATPVECAGRWVAQHQGVVFACTLVLVAAIAAASFAVALGVIAGGADEAARARPDAQTGETAAVDHAELPYISFRFTSFNDMGWPVVTLGMSASTSDGSALPALSAEHVELTELDAEGNEVASAPTGFAFDPATGSTQISFNADTASLGAQRTVEFALAETSGYRGGGSFSYRVPGA